ncbi:MAG TPA: GWxTD domain-containing protein [Gemmatimonadales bacterium]|nr:GWxTD domain-containing protein [Gemmatimonadales bacterium]
MIRGSAAILVLVLHAARVLGQAPGDRLALQRFRDSLSRVDDTTSLRDYQHRLHSSSTSNGDTDRLRAGLLAFRLAELGADRDFGDAIDLFRKLTARRPDWPLAWHALGLAEARRAAWEQSDPLALGNRVGVRTLARAAADQRRALDADSSFDPAALALASLTLGLRDTALYASACDALRRAGAPPSASATVLLAWGRMERAAGRMGDAATVFRRALAAAGRSPALALLELARTRLAADGADGEQAYYEGAALDDVAAVAGYRADLVPIATKTELAGFDRSRGAARVEFLRDFWTERDRLELRASGERLREHYRRLLYASRHFALTTTRRFYGDRDAYRSGSEELDDRGIIYVRHGEPGERHRPFVFGLMPNESWRYARADGDLLFHFTAGYDSGAGGDLYDYRLVESVLDMRGASEAPVDQLLLSRQSLSPVYGRMLNWGAGGAARARARERSIGRVSIAYGTTTDSYELQFSRRLTAYADLVAIGQRDGAPVAQFVFAIGAAETTPVHEVGGVSYPVRVRLVALDALEHAAGNVDTIVVFRLDRPLSRGRYLIGRVELPLPAGGWSWRAALSQGHDAGVVLPRDTVRVEGPGPGLGLSDLALGIRAASARWLPTPADTVLLTPFKLFLEGSEVELYYEASGTVPGTAYRHQIAVYRLKGDGRLEPRPVVTLGFEERAEGVLLRSHRTLQLGRLKPGAYVVEVKVAGPAAEPVRRRRELRVVRGER